MTDSVIRLKIELDRTDPPNWRRIEVPAAITLKNLHRIIQAAMGWEDDHLFAFQIGRQKASSRVQLAELVAQRIKRIGYLYDIGDSWQHMLRLEKTIAADPAASYPRLVDGAGHCPPEDCGGIPGFYDFLEAIADPQHPDHKDRLDWYGGPFDPADMDAAQINQELAHRRSAKGSIAQGKALIFDTPGRHELTRAASPDAYGEQIKIWNAPASGGGSRTTQNAANSLSQRRFVFGCGGRINPDSYVGAPTLTAVAEVSGRPHNTISPSRAARR